MSNPKTLDRRDVAHSTNPIGGNEHIEKAAVPERVDAGQAEAWKLGTTGLKTGKRNFEAISSTRRDDRAAL